jgi:hypothetical protein
VTCALNGSGNAALILEAVARDTARQKLALFIDELEKEVRVLVVNVFDAEFAETAIFFVPETNFWIAQELYIFS